MFDQEARGLRHEVGGLRESCGCSRACPESVEGFKGSKFKASERDVSAYVCDEHEYFCSAAT
jgi:hypothetical protein